MLLNTHLLTPNSIKDNAQHNLTE